MHVSTDQILKTIEQIYAAPLIDSGWIAAMQSISELLGAEMSTYSGSQADQVVYKPTFMHHDSDNRDAVKQYIEYYHTLCERGRYSRNESPGSIYYDYKYFSESEMRKSEYYDFLAKNGGKYAMGTTLWKPRKHWEEAGIQQCAVHFSDRQGHPKPAKVELFQKLVPHLMRSNLMSRELGAKSVLAGELQVAIDQIPSSLICLTSDLAVKFMNQSAEKLLALQDGISYRAGKLDFGSSKQRKQFLDFVLQTKKGEILDQKRQLLIPIERPSGQRPFALLVTPTAYPDRYKDEVGRSGISFQVLICDLDASTPSKPEIFSTTFRLTIAEARLASALVAGVDLGSYAQCNGLSVETVRWHLKNVFVKTGTGRQSELVRLLSSLTLPLH